MTPTNKIPESLENAYQESLISEKIKGFRVMCVLGLILYTVFLVVDVYALSSAVLEAKVIRLFIITGFLIAYLVSYYKAFISFYSYIQPIFYLYAASGIHAMIYLAEPADKASDVYFAGLLLVIMVLFSGAYISLKSLFVTTMIIIGVYISVEVYKHGVSITAPESLAVLLPNLSFLFSACIIGFIAHMMRENYLRQNFLLQHSLRKLVKEKTHEAKISDYYAKQSVYAANHDSLTMLPNRRYIKKLLTESIDFAKQRDKVVAILFLDLNGFKQVNDIHGHAVGDELLVIVAKRLELAIRQGDNIARLGGDEFVVSLMMEQESLAYMKKMIQKISDTLTAPMSIDGLRLTVGVSIGVSAYPMNGSNVNELLDIADTKMYETKKKKNDFNAKSFNSAHVVDLWR